MHIKLHYILYIFIVSALFGCFTSGRETFTISPPPSQQNQENETKVAIEALSDAIRANPSVAENYFKRANLYFQENMLDEALADIERAEVLAPTIPAYLFTKAKILKSKGSFDQALKYALRVESMDYEMPPLFTTLAEIYTLKKDTSNASFYLNKAYALAPYNGETHYIEGLYHELKGDTLQAIKKFNNSLSFDKYQKLPYNQLIAIYDKRKLYDSSLTVNKKAVIAFPTDLDFSIGIGERLENKFLIDSAIVIYKNILKTNANRVDIHIKIGNARLKQKNYEEALVSYETALKKMSDNADVYYLAGLCNDKMERYSEAQSYYIKALRINADFQKAKDALDRVTYLINAAIGI